jgi:hypothetical protein
MLCRIPVKLTLSLQADVESTAVADVKYNFALQMDVMEVDQELYLVNLRTAGPPFTIKPSADPSTKDYTVAAPSVTFTQKSLNNDTYVKDAQDVVVWQGTVRANDVEDLVIRSMYFQNDGTADPRRY